jgi:predicted Kef-type K+ transport protein
MEVFTFSLENFSRRILMVNVIGLPGAWQEQCVACADNFSGSDNIDYAEFDLLVSSLCLKISSDVIQF